MAEAISITRRKFLKVPPAAVVAVATPAIATAAQPKVTARERYDWHLAELKKAAQELDPHIGYWNIARAEGDDQSHALVITAIRVTGRYEGDGSYEAGQSDWNGKHTLYHVKLLDHRVDGQRMFAVETSMDRMILAEPRFNTFIGRKIA